LRIEQLEAFMQFRDFIAARGQVAVTVVTLFPPLARFGNLSLHIAEGRLQLFESAPRWAGFFGIRAIGVFRQLREFVFELIICANTLGRVDGRPSWRANCCRLIGTGCECSIPAYD
jgi:hypothetical protein